MCGLELLNTVDSLTTVQTVQIVCAVIFVFVSALRAGPKSELCISTFPCAPQLQMVKHLEQAARIIMQVPTATFVKNTNGEWVLKTEESVGAACDYVGSEAEALRLLSLYQPTFFAADKSCFFG